MKTVFIDYNDIDTMVRRLKGQGYLVFKNTEDLSYPEFNKVLEIFVAEGFHVMSVR